MIFILSVGRYGPLLISDSGVVRSAATGGLRTIFERGKGYKGRRVRAMSEEWFP